MIEENPDDVAVSVFVDGTIMVRMEDRLMRFTDYKEP